MNLFINKDTKPMLSSHRGGAITNPESTLKAYKDTVNYGVKLIESDLHLTKDNVLVLSHDETVDRLTDVQIKDDKKVHYIKDYTLLELKSFNFGYNYFDGKSYPYKNITRERIEKEGLSITTLDELFYLFKDNKEMLFIFDIKESGERGFLSARLVYEIISKYLGLIDRVIIGSFNEEVINYLRLNYPDVKRGAGVKDVIRFIKPFTKDFDFYSLSIPSFYKYKGIKINLAKKRLIKKAHKYGIAIHFWTINTEKEMRKLIKLNPDAIMTDDLKLYNLVIK